MKGLLLMPCLAAAAPNAWRRWRHQQQQQMPEPVAPEWTKEMPQTWEPALLRDWRGVARVRLVRARGPEARLLPGFWGAFVMTASMSAPFHNASSTGTAQGYAATGLDACVARCDGIARKCLRGALPARGAIAVRPDARGALRARGERRAAGMCGDVGLK